MDGRFHHHHPPRFPRFPLFPLFKKQCRRHKTHLTQGRAFVNRKDDDVVKEDGEDDVSLSLYTFSPFPPFLPLSSPTPLIFPCL